jgi:hypothetical protein
MLGQRASGEMILRKKLLPKMFAGVGKRSREAAVVDHD